MNDSTATVHLVDPITGEDVPVFEKDNVPIDPWDSPYWDVWHYEISDPAEREELGRLALEHAQDLADAPTPGEARWLELMWSGSLPPVAGGAPEYTAADRADLEAWLEQVDRDYPPANQISDDERGQLAAFGCI
jgi:hypothetical protein